MLLDDTYASYINLDHRRDRRRRMEQTLRDAGISAVRTRGMLPSEYQGDPARVKVMQDRTPGAIGCWMAQVGVMQEALRQGRHAMVLEDDLVFCDDFWDRIVIVDGFLATHPWDVFWLGGTWHTDARWHGATLGRDAEETDHPRIVRTFAAFSTFAYAIRSGSIALILELLDHHLSQSVGIDTSFIHLQPQLHTYAFVPGCVRQYDNRSNIGKGITNFSGFAALGPHWYQTRMEDFAPQPGWLTNKEALS